MLAPCLNCDQSNPILTTAIFQSYIIVQSTWSPGFFPKIALDSLGLHHYTTVHFWNEWGLWKPLNWLQSTAGMIVSLLRTLELFFKFLTEPVERSVYWSNTVHPTKCTILIGTLKADWMFFPRKSLSGNVVQHDGCLTVTMFLLTFSVKFLFFSFLQFVIKSSLFLIYHEVRIAR